MNKKEVFESYLNFLEDGFNNQLKGFFLLTFSLIFGSLLFSLNFLPIGKANVVSSWLILSVLALFAMQYVYIFITINAGVMWRVISFLTFSLILTTGSFVGLIFLLLDGFILASLVGCLLVKIFKFKEEGND